MFRSLRWRIAIPHLILILLTMGGLSIYLSDLARQSHLDDLRGKLTDDARLIADAAGPRGDWAEAGGELDRLARHYRNLIDARVTFMAGDGTVLGDSHADHADMDNHLRRVEVQQALATGRGSSTRFSRTMGFDMMYVAVPVLLEEELVGLARVALPVSRVEAQVARLQRVTLAAAAIAVLGAAGMAVVIAERIARPVRQLTEVVRRMSAGDLGARLHPTTSDEIGELTTSFNQMANRLRKTIDSLSEQQTRLAAVLENMADGVIITDDQGLVRLVNPAAAACLGLKIELALGRSLPQVVRDHRIIALWRRCYQDRVEQVEAVERASRESEAMARTGAFLQVIVTPLPDSDGQSCLIILQDLTRVHRLETVRRDFITNISHELRTPMASLKALVDTLRDGALEDPPAAQRFLDRMETEVDSLTQTVQELLQLSRIESGRAPIRLEPVDVADVVLPPVERLRPQAERAKLDLSVDVPPDLPPVLADGDRIQQVVTNLVHNAIKFTLPEGSVGVSARAVRVAEDAGPLPEQRVPEAPALKPGEWVLITVADTGVGIPRRDLSRVFERFYKSDRARSGGGTGLGLSIAKHIVQAHGGHIWVESVEGRGSSFYVALRALTSR